MSHLATTVLRRRDIARVYRAVAARIRHMASIDVALQWLESTAAGYDEAADEAAQGGEVRTRTVWASEHDFPGGLPERWETGADRALAERRVTTWNKKGVTSRLVYQEVVEVAGRWRETEPTVHLMIPDVHPARGLAGTAAYACDLDGSAGVQAPMLQRTLDPAKVTCPDCKASVAAKG